MNKLRNELRARIDEAGLILIEEWYDSHHRLTINKPPGEQLFTLGDDDMPDDGEETHFRDAISWITNQPHGSAQPTSS